MVEQPHSGERHGDAVLVAILANIVVTYAAASLSDVFHSALVGALDVVTEWEKSI